MGDTEDLIALLSGPLHRKVKKNIKDGLLLCIDVHGPINKENVGSASKRIYANLKSTLNQIRDTL